MNKEGYQPIKTEKTTKIIPPNTGSHVKIKTDNTETFKNALNRIAELEKEITELKKACDETQELLDKQIEATYKLDKENAELKEINADLKQSLDWANERESENVKRITELEKENAKLQAKIDDWQSEYIELENLKNSQLTQAKKIIGNLYAICKDNHYPNSSVLMEQAEQLLNEVEDD